MGRYAIAAIAVSLVAVIGTGLSSSSSLPSTMLLFANAFAPEMYNHQINRRSHYYHDRSIFDPSTLTHSALESFTTTSRTIRSPFTTTRLYATESSSSSSTETTPTESSNDPNEIIARTIIVQGDVQGGYYRACVLNEGGRFRRLTGTMTPPDESSDTAEIYVEGKRRQVDGFIKWCRRGNNNVGLSQVTKVLDVIDAEVTGLYDDFYVKTK